MCYSCVRIDVRVIHSRLNISVVYGCKGDWIYNPVAKSCIKLLSKPPKGNDNAQKMCEERGSLLISFQSEAAYNWFMALKTVHPGKSVVIPNFQFGCK